ILLLDDVSFYPSYNRNPYATTGGYEYAAPPSRASFEPKRGGDEDLNAFGMSYAAMAGLDIQHAYDDPLTPPLGEGFEFEVVGEEENYNLFQDGGQSWSPEPLI
ncbi:hypothetical protein V493_04696, partial [Pseudogymnoascus sp. VKM F-4281 (FW-2241)]